MRVKDYYKILELQPGAGAEAIKKNFRRLALRFHPDTNRGEQHAEAWYREIQEAYDVLSTPTLKAQYLQERWLLQSTGKPFAEAFPLTPVYIEKRCADFCQTVQNMDHFRLDHVGLQKQLLALVNDDVLNALLQYKEDAANEKIIGHLLYCMEPLDYEYLQVFNPILTSIAGNHQASLQLVNSWFKRRKQEHWWAKHQGWIIAVITLLLCGLIIIVTQ